ncbi:MAG: DUF4397 domain-containing protein [Kofleriaceae bacterium]
MYLVAFTGCTAVTDEPITGARVRVAHLSPDAPAVDFCIAEAGSGEFAGPVLAGAGGLAGISYGKVTKYLDVPAAQYDVRLVAPGSTSCETALGGLADFTNLPALTDGATATIAATGNLAHGGDPFALRAYIDDATVDAGQVKLRFIHASPGTPNVDVGIGGGVAFTPVFENIEFGATRAHDNGYFLTAPFAGLELSARVTGTTTDVIAVKPAKLADGAIATAFAIGELGNAQAPLQVLLCNDNAAPHQIETECAQVGGPPERARVRVAHLSPDAPAVDVCITTAGGAFDKPLLASLNGRLGISYPQITTYVELPIASYDVRVILATDTNCETAAVPDTKGITLAPGLTATVAAIGALDRSGPAIANPGFRLAVFADADAATTGKAKLRFVHASPGTPNVDVGIHAGGVFTTLFGNVEFGKVAVHGGIDSIGYLETDPLTTSIAARVTGSATNALFIPNVSLAAGNLVTAFAIGNKTGATTNPLAVLLCSDNVVTGTLLSQCTVAH